MKIWNENHEKGWKLLILLKFSFFSETEICYHNIFATSLKLNFI